MPRKFKPDGAQRERCVCAQHDNLGEAGLQEYDGCPADSERCKVVVT